MTDTCETRKIALFGGTFDPIHKGHLFVAAGARERCGLDQVIFLPCWQSPHKSGGLPASAGHHRLQMTRLAVQNLPWATVSDHEIEQASPSYSWLSARHFHRQLPDARLFWLLGADQWRMIDSWSHPEVLAALLTFIVFARDGVAPEPRPGFTSVFLPGTFDASATRIRTALALGKAPREVPEEVLAYITRNGLYSSHPKP